MHAIGGLSALYVVCMVLLVPALAFRGAGMVSARAGIPARRAMPSRVMIYLNSIVLLSLLFALTQFVAGTLEYRLFPRPAFGTRELIAGAGALLFQFAMLFASHAMRSADERRAMPVNRILPQSAAERALFSAAAVVAGISEEAAYRGVLPVILSSALGSAWPAVFISALAFAAGHAVQGRKSAAVIFIMACAMHALVWYTGTLVIAMAVHASYDLLVPTIRRRIWPAPPTGPERIAG